MTIHNHRDTFSAAPPDKVASDDVLFELLAAYQFLQGQNVRMASDLSTRLAVGPNDLRVLMFIDRTPNATPKEVAHQLQMATGSVTALLDRLEQSGHVLRHRHPTDRRSLTLCLTSLGDEAVAAVRGAYRAAFDGIFSHDEIGHVARVLQALGKSIDQAIATDGNTDR